MKKIGIYFLIFVLSVVIFLFGFNYKTSKQPQTYYNVYLDSEFIGMIESKEELEKYINTQADSIRKNLRKYKLKIDAIDTFNKYIGLEGLQTYSNGDKAKFLLTNKDNYNLSDIDLDNIKFYLEEKLFNLTDIEIQEMRNYINTNDIYSHTNNVYTPNGIEIKKVYTYHDDIIAVPEIYKRIIAKKSCTVPGYKFTIKSTNEGVDDIIVYTMDKKIFSDAIENLITIFVDDNSYVAYKNDNQIEITSTGSVIENIYVEQDITYKAVNISVEEKIYTDATSLSAYLLYGDTYEERIVQVKPGDSIESLAFENQISVQEFLIFNPQYTSRDNLLVTGTDIVISKIDPKIQIVVEKYEVVDKTTDFAVVEQYDESISQGSMVVSQEGETGVERVSQNVKSINGEIAYVDPVDKEVIKSPVSKIINIGTKYVPSVGSTTSWGWPTNSGYTISSYYGYRLAVFGEGNFHSGLDIAGTGYGSPVYAANNGVIDQMEYRSDNGNYIQINHNNGYYSFYAHMARFAPGLSIGSTVARGQVIGYVGSSGWSTGPHLHFEIRNCSGYKCHTNPFNFY